MQAQAGFPVVFKCRGRVLYCVIPPEDAVVNHEPLMVVIRLLRRAAFVVQKPCHGEVNAAHEVVICTQVGGRRVEVGGSLQKEITSHAMAER